MLKFLFWASAALIVYVYFGYPVLVDLLSRWRKGVRESCAALAEWPRVTVVIPAYNEERWIERKIENTLALDYPSDRLQIVVASDGCTDRTVEIVGQYAGRGVEISYRPERAGKMASMNRAIAEAHGEIVLSTDCNALLSPDSLKLLVRRFEDSTVGSVTGEKVCLPSHSSASEGEGFYWRYDGWIKRSENRLFSCLGGHGQILAVRRSLIPHIPGTSDDFYIPMQILISQGKRLAFEPRARACIPAADTLGQELKRKIRTHRSLFENAWFLREGLKPWKSSIWWQFWSHHILRLFVPIALLLSLFSCAFLWRAGAFYRATALGQYIFYAAAATGYLFVRRGVRLRIFYAPFYFVFANLAVLVAWLHFIRGKRQYAWQRTERMGPSAERESGRAG